MSFVSVRDASGVRHVTIARPEKRNALTRTMYTDLASALHGASVDPDLRVLVLRGSDGVFTAGNDLLDFMEAPPVGLSGPVVDFLRALVDFDKPLIAVVEGPAVGIGTTLLLHCDLVYASPEARFRLPFVNLALVPEAGSSFLLPATCGHRRAAALLMLGDVFDAHTARELGLVTEIVADADLYARVEGVAARLCAQPPEALIATKRLMKAPFEKEIDRAMLAEGKAFVERLRSTEAAAAFAAFFNR